MEKRREQLDDSQSQRSIGRISVGTAHTARSAVDLDKALIAIYQEWGEDTEHEDLAAVLYEAGTANYTEGNYAKAADHLALALDMYRNLQTAGGDEELFAAEIANLSKMLGMVHLARAGMAHACQGTEKTAKEYKKAISYFAQALREKVKLYGSVINSDIAETERYLGLSYLSQNQIAAAIEHLDLAMTAFKQIYDADADHVEIADTYYHLGCAHQQGNNNSEAIAQFVAASAMYQELFPEHHPKIAETFCKIGFVNLAMAHYEKAINSFKKAYEIYTVKAQDNPTIDLSYVDLVFHLGQTYHKVGKFAEAKTHLSNAWFLYQALYRGTPGHLAIVAAKEALEETELAIVSEREQEQAGSEREQKQAHSDARSTSALSVRPTTKQGKEDPALTRPPNVQPSSNSSIGVDNSRLSAAASTATVFHHNATTSKAAAAPTEEVQRPTLQALKAYYLSKAGLFNASKKIFKTDNVEDAITELLSRAGNGGASADTLAHFKIRRN